MGFALEQCSSGNDSYSCSVPSFRHKGTPSASQKWHL